ncbi:CPCC family cysteine-rich protein [Chitinophaga ginsengisoli]|uniref:Cysteine-rich CPCC n=1 Tax=Chitinophaga ginsengisoli TaxID=363837 RepID=A0A2P8FUM6_9BACT|nr:CPCC family cysteine-rich protein [Chitinophaga ginsengisoli]PSL25345.1 Cysteine-rich CPCC [Chitinophaga ginsengisoli]
MNDAEILAAFYVRRAHYDTYLEANNIHLYTCPGCGFPSLTDRREFSICIICFWEDDGQDDNADSILNGLFEGISLSGPNGNLTLTENRINIGYILETNAEQINGEIDPDPARVLKTIEFYQQRRGEIEDRMTGHEDPYDHIWIEWKEVRKDLQMALVVPKL